MRWDFSPELLGFGAPAMTNNEEGYQEVMGRRKDATTAIDEHYRANGEEHLQTTIAGQQRQAAVVTSMRAPAVVARCAIVTITRQPLATTSHASEI